MNNNNNDNNVSDLVPVLKELKKLNNLPPEKPIFHRKIACNKKCKKNLCNHYTYGNDCGYCEGCCSCTKCSQCKQTLTPDEEKVHECYP